MGCVHQSEKEIVETQKKRHDRTQKNKNKPEPKAVNFLGVPQQGSKGGTSKNLFKTFSDWGQDEDPRQLQQIQKAKVRRRRASEDLLVVPKFNDISNTTNDRQIKTTTTTNIQISHEGRQVINVKPVKKPKK